MIFRALNRRVAPAGSADMLADIDQCGDQFGQFLARSGPCPGLLQNLRGHGACAALPVDLGRDNPFTGRFASSELGDSGAVALCACPARDCLMERASLQTPY